MGFLTCTANSLHCNLASIHPLLWVKRVPIKVTNEWVLNPLIYQTFFISHLSHIFPYNKNYLLFFCLLETLTPMHLHSRPLLFSPATSLECLLEFLMDSSFSADPSIKKKKKCYLGLFLHIKNWEALHTTSHTHGLSHRLVLMTHKSIFLLLITF